MSDEGITAEPGSTEGTPDSGPVEATAADSQVAEGQSEDTGQSTEPGSEDSFFDPNELDPSLVPAYKNMQKAFTKKMQEISANRHKIEAFDAFNSDPLSVIQREAARMGYQLSRADAQAVQDQQRAEFEPNTWDDVMERASALAEQRIMEKFAPVLNEVRQIKRGSVESQLNDIDPTWQQYEGEMRSVLQTHPTLANDPAALYRMSVPPEVLESRAVQKALKKMENKAQGSKVSGSSKTTKTPGMNVPDKPVTFGDAVAFARKQVAEQGLRPD
jgi:hypothetical protein